MELHPDRNYGSVEETTRLFAEVQSAYEVLSDPQERAWYDSHRDTILRDEDRLSGEHFERNMRVTTAKDLLYMFSKLNGTMDFSDSTTGFYGVIRDMFATLANEEEVAFEWEGLDPILYPSFGYSNDDYDTVVKPFYAAWNGFATKKSFSWKDVYRYPDAPDRRVRRLMEKENTRFREEGIREFNDAVRSLIAFVRKRDPRFKPNTQSEAERQRILRDAVAAQAARSRAANQARSAPKGPIPEWMMKPKEVEYDKSDEEEDEPDEHIECVVCKKYFKTEKQYEAHERSRKHTKTIQQLRKRMKRENITLDLEKSPTVGEAQSAESVNPNPFDVAGENSAEEIRNDGTEEPPPNTHSDRDFGASGLEGFDGEQNTHNTLREGDVTEFPNPDSSSSSWDGEYAEQERVVSRVLGQGIADESSPEDLATQPNIDDLSQEFAAESLEDEIDSKTQQPKLGKAKAKRAKKAAQNSAAAASLDTEFKCAACQVSFPSKTRLFNHIKDLGHAQPVLKATKDGKVKKHYRS